MTISIGLHNNSRYCCMCSIGFRVSLSEYNDDDEDDDDDNDDDDADTLAVDVAAA